ncbi:non-canonical purine NTP diphosphatase [Porphyromonadaceae bacterium W3.11]|nr:non-canonical purine NTP diphosphatase [Porphyromonadaceae bacterium W3.11]
MKSKLLVATHNKHKLHEIKDILDREGVNIELVSLFDLHDFEDIPEDGNTLEDNALQKARTVYQRHHLDCFADDTGLEVAALDGAPGVYSARYAGPDCDPEQNIEKLLGQLEGHGERTAKFRTVVALILDGKEYLFEGTVEGEILSEKRGSSGFGYDPIFLPKGFDKSFAEMSDSEKNKISHRGRAIEALANYLKEHKF